MQILFNQPKFNNINIVRKRNNENKQNNVTKNSYSGINPIYYPTFTAIKTKIAPTKLERFEGCLLGGAIGDALGANVEFLSLNKIKQKYGDYGVTFTKIIKPQNILEFTDDTQMTLYTIDGLIKSAIKNSSIKNLDFNCIYESYLDWLNAQEKRTQTQKGWINNLSSVSKFKYPGNTCIEALVNKTPGTINHKINSSKGNGGIMRVAPIGLMYYKTPVKAFDIGMASALLTHSEPDAYLSAGALASIVAYIVNGHTLEESISKTVKILKNKNNSEDIIFKINEAKKLANSIINSEDALETLGRGGIGSEALGIAIYCSLKHKNDLEKALELAANINGDSDTVAAITGNIVGTYIGSSSIPNSIKNVENFNEILTIAKDLSDPLNIADKKTKYPTKKSTLPPLTLNDIIKPKQEIKKEKNNQELVRKVKNISTLKINNIADFLYSNQTLPTNIIKNIIIPLELITDSPQNDDNTTKMIRILIENCDSLIEKENLRHCWDDEKKHLSDILWQLYEICLYNSENADKVYEIVTIMIASERYNINQILELISENKDANRDELNRIINNLYKL